MRPIPLKILAMSVFTSLGLGTSGQNLKNAHKLFSAGKFVEAKAAYAAVLAKNSTHLQSMIYMGHTFITFRSVG